MQDGATARVVETLCSGHSLSFAEKNRLVELLCIGVERRLKQRGCVDFSSHLSVDADAPRRNATWSS